MVRITQSDTSRRQFLSRAAGLVAAHCNLASDDARPASSSGEPRILSLELQTCAPLASMEQFYQRLLGLRVLGNLPDRLTLAAGGTRITFVKMQAEHANPFYHFAFNIPENKILSARSWQKERTPLLPIPERLRDPRFPDDIVNYSHWNAHSVFFFDPGGNVVEYIARHDLKNGAPGRFTSKDILYASEIAWVVDDVADATSQLKEVAGLEQYRGGDDQFRAIGDERGLLLVMKRGRVISFDAKETKAVDVFPTIATVRGLKRERYIIPTFPYELSAGAP